MSDGRLARYDCPSRKGTIMEEYNPDEINEKSTPGKAEGFDDSKYVRVPIDDRTPLSADNPKYPEKYKKHLAEGVPMMLCPECKSLGLHRVREDDQPQYPGASRIGGEICDICGGGDTYEVAF